MTAANTTIGIIDIGSNSVRMVGYDMATAAPGKMPRRFFREKVICGLGQDLDKTGKLSREGMDKARLAIEGFLLIGKAIGFEEMQVVATAAVREATDGAAFVELIEMGFNVHVRILDGEDEARYSALGVASAFLGAQGLMADLGGGSLELAVLPNPKNPLEPTRNFTAPLGVLRIKANDTPEAYIEKYLNDLSSDFQNADALYAVGGALRAFGAAHLTVQGKSVDDIHGYQMSAGETLSLIKDLQTLPADVLQETYGFDSRRSHLMPSAALVMEALIHKTGVENIIYSKSGLRDGMLFEQLNG